MLRYFPNVTLPQAVEGSNHLKQVHGSWRLRWRQGFWMDSSELVIENIGMRYMRGEQYNGS